ncbi:MAG: response regulator [Gammaproteobacteria bacterium]
MEKRILLVEDNLFNQKVTAMMFADAGYNQVDLAETGHDALKLCQKYRYDLVLLDMGLPDISGLEVAAALRNHEKSQNAFPTPLIALTAHSFDEDQQQAKAVGIDDYLVKPLFVKQLRKLCKERLAC